MTKFAAEAVSAMLRRSPQRRTGALVLIAISVALTAASLAVDRHVPAASAQVSAPQTSTDVQHDLSPPLRELIAGSHTKTTVPSRSTAAQVSGPKLPQAACPAIAQNFPGMVNGGTTFATDASGAVGPNHFFQAVNFSAAIYDKSGNLLLGPFSTAQFWNGFAGGPCGGGWSDVVILYDRAADRWFVSRFARQNNASPFNWYQCFAVSQTPDPTGSYYRYAFLMDSDEFDDFPKFGIWPDAYYMTADRNKIFPGLGNFVAAFDRSAMLAGLTASDVVFKIDNNGNRAGMLPADWDGHVAPPSGAPGLFIKTLDTNLGWPNFAIQIWKMQVDWTNSTFLLGVDTTLTPNDFNSALCGLSQNCIPQLNTSQGLDPLAGGRPSFRLAYRNLGTHETLTFGQTVDVGDISPVHAGIRWYELRKAAGAWSIYQQSTFAPDNDHRWIGSLAMDEPGNMAMGYNVSGSVYPALRVGGRKAADALNTMVEEFTLQAGSGAQTGAVFWGDYSQTTLDPADDCTFWHVGSFQPNTSAQPNWATQIGSFRFCDCRADLGVTKSRAPLGVIDAGTDVTYTVGLTNNGPRSAGNVTMHDNVPAETAFVSITAPAGWTCTTPVVGGSGAIACTKGQVDANEIATFTVVVTAKCSAANGAQVDNTASVDAATPPDDNNANDSAQASFLINNPTPAVSASVATSRLWPNNHDLVNVGLSVSGSDGSCPLTPVVQVFSNEGDLAHKPDGNFSPDAKDIAPGTLRLRRERWNDARVYLIVVTATDGAGSSSFATTTVVVPRNLSSTEKAEAAHAAAAAKNYADTHNGQPPPNYFRVGNGPIRGPKQ